ncbi:MAG: VWA domain-containing protein [Candidatus Firestonebacteria bacterium]|mgnify:CR=1 FL=1
MRFAYPIYLMILLFIPVFLWFKLKYKGNAVIKYSDLNIMQKLPPTNANLKQQIIWGLRILTITLLTLALARPQAGEKSEEISTKGVDIILCMDTSTSMRAEDFKPKNRLYVAKEVAKEFIKGRKHDRIGIVVFSAISFTQCPLTLDYGAVTDFMDKVEIGMTQTDGTAIGTAIATSTNRLKDSTAKSKVIILLTDGRNNMGEIDPQTAAKVAGTMAVKIYTIGMGVPGGAIFPIDDPIFGRRYVKLQEDLDENTLQEIATTTEGMYFRATSPEALREIYKKIDTMEKTEIKVKEYTNYIELYKYFAFPAFILLLGEIILASTILRKIP